MLHIQSIHKGRSEIVSGAGPDRHPQVSPGPWTTPDVMPKEGDVVRRSCVLASGFRPDATATLVIVSAHVVKHGMDVGRSSRPVNDLLL